MNNSPEVMLLLFLRGSTTDSTGMELVLRRLLSHWERSYNVFVYDVEKFPQLAERYEIAATPTLVFDDLQTGERRQLVGLFAEEQIHNFLKDTVSADN